MHGAASQAFFCANLMKELRFQDTSVHLGCRRRPNQGKGAGGKSSLQKKTSFLLI